MLRISELGCLRARGTIADATSAGECLPVGRLAHIVVGSIPPLPGWAGHQVVEHGLLAPRVIIPLADRRLVRHNHPYLDQ
jgi:hypothetical protein